MLRSLVIGRIGSAGHKGVVDEAKKRFAAHCDGSAELPADLRSSVSRYQDTGVTIRHEYVNLSKGELL